MFQERLDRVIRLLPGVIGIADDILTHGSMIKEHNGRVISLLETARLNSLTLNSKKIQFRSQDCKFFIHRLTSEGLKADSFKVSAITQMKFSETIQDLRSLLGMVNYFNRFDLTLSDLTDPLRRLCKQDVMWTWDSKQQTTFKKIKSIISNLPVLVFFNQDKNHIIQSAASKKGLSAVLLQDGQPVIYASQTQMETEQQYSNIDRELLGVVFALKRLNHYTYGFTITVQSDHEPLMSIWKKTIAAASPRLWRLLLRLSKYNIEIEYLQGKENVKADALSRVCLLPPM